jgi:hypothetical protein
MFSAADFPASTGFGRYFVRESQVARFQYPNFQSLNRGDRFASAETGFGVAIARTEAAILPREETGCDVVRKTCA